VLLAAVALAGGLSACGADEELSSDIPRTSPDLTIPTATTELAPADTTPSTTTATISTTPQAGAAAPPAAVQPPPVAVAPPPPPASTTGGAGAGAGAGTQGTPTTGGAAPSDPDFQNFCRDNPGAPPPC